MKKRIVILGSTGSIGLNTLELARNLKEQIEVSVCGEMAGDPLCILILLGFGITELSMNALSIPKVKEIVRSVEYDMSRSLLERILELDSAEEVEKFVRKELAKILGPVYTKYISLS